MGGDDLSVGDVVFMPGAPEGHDTLGRIVDIRDHGMEIWVRTVGNPSRVYYTFYDQVQKTSHLDQLARRIFDDTA